MSAGLTERALPHVATYKRTLRAGVETLYRNALDWEHLPALHASSFSAIECLEEGDWGWRAKIDFQPAGSGRHVVQELRLEREHRRWINRTLEGATPGAEVWTVAVPVAPDATEVIVDFFHPGIPEERREALGQAYCQLWETLYDEDERVMMGVEREQRPGELSFQGRSYRVVEVDGGFVAHATRCPHRGASLADCAVVDGRITCPFHGYAFDLRTGQSADGRNLRLPPAPRVERGEDGGFRLVSALTGQEHHPSAGRRGSLA